MLMYENALIKNLKEGRRVYGFLKEKSSRLIKELKM